MCCGCADGNAGPDGSFPDGTKQPGDHLRKVFYRMGFNDQDIVALSGMSSQPPPPPPPFSPIHSRPCTLTMAQ